MRPPTSVDYERFAWTMGTLVLYCSNLKCLAVEWRTDSPHSKTDQTKLVSCQANEALIIKVHSSTDLKYLLNQQVKFVLTECLPSRTNKRKSDSSFWPIVFNIWKLTIKELFTKQNLCGRLKAIISIITHFEKLFGK